MSEQAICVELLIRDTRGLPWWEQIRVALRTPRVQLLDDLYVSMPDGEQVIPAGTRVDGVSAGRVLGMLLPRYGSMFVPSVVHDHELRTRIRRWSDGTMVTLRHRREVDQRLRASAEHLTGMRWLALLMYAFVRVGSRGAWRNSGSMG